MHDEYCWASEETADDSCVLFGVSPVLLLISFTAPAFRSTPQKVTIR